MNSDLGMEPYAVVPYNPHQERPYNSFKDELQNNALMSPAFTYPDPNEEFWERINTLPQLANDANVSSHDEFALTPSVNHSHVTSSHRGANPVAARASASTTTRSSDHINADSVPAHASHIPHSSTLKEARLLTSELHLCKTCCAAVQALVRYVVYLPSRRTKTEDIQLRYHNSPGESHLLYLSWYQLFNYH